MFAVTRTVVSGAAVAALLVSTLSAGCGQKDPAPTPAPSEATSADAATPPEVEAPTPGAEVATPEAPVVVQAPSDPVVPAADANEGLRGLSIRFFDAFKAWQTRATEAGARVRAVASSEVSNGASAAFDEERGQDDACRRSWVVLEVLDREGGAGLGDISESRFGGDCCESLDCERSPEGHHLHFLRALEAKDWAAVVSHLPPEGALTLVITTPEGEQRSTTGRAAIAAGQKDIPGCGPLAGRPSCDDEVDAEGRFSCRCDAGGYHVTYSYQMPEYRRGLASLTMIASDEH